MAHSEAPTPDNPLIQSPESSFLATLDADTAVLLVFTMVIAWALAQLTLILWKKLTERLRAKKRKSDEQEPYDEAVYKK